MSSSLFIIYFQYTIIWMKKKDLPSETNTKIDAERVLGAEHV